ncbi:heme o synthase [Aneurinibacillus sp. Ricciae_BoGa-3]|uniref:heme o synthase n=1 Tax=Aneurinibacillus sp. Ricciae_BoGa-3 TaxID=3022697 RepID=UPI002341075C|nr:heme o synthase [Aneurinibacillus sp. Ricciae_BoGa-3]WCK54035.1 heme o synthase [Aneurinibacillus sp. Ricciae_BoGa-3]
MGAPVDQTIENNNLIEKPAELMKAKGTWRDYVEVTKTGITVSNLMTAFVGFWIATQGPLDMVTMLLAMIGTALVIMSGTALNNFIDRDLDMLMERTKTRALPSGRLEPANVLRFGIILGVLGTITLASINVLTAVLGLVALFFYVVVYTLWTKRTTTLNTLVGGISGAMPPIMGYAAVKGSLDETALILFTVLFIWQVPHFLALAMRKAKDYSAAGFQMLPSVSGFKVTKRHILSYTIALLPVSLFLYEVGAVGIVYFIGMALLGLGYVVLNMSGFFMKDTMKFARMSFIYSLVYIMMFSILIIMDHA